MLLRDNLIVWVKYYRILVNHPASMKDKEGVTHCKYKNLMIDLSSVGFGT